MLDLTNDELGRKNGLIWPSLFMHNALLAKSENEVTHLLTWQNTRLSSVHWNWLKRLWAWRLNWPAFKDMKTWTLSRRGIFTFFRLIGLKQHDYNANRHLATNVLIYLRYDILQDSRYIDWVESLRSSKILIKKRLAAT